MIQRPGFTAEGRVVFTVRREPATNEGYERWFPELRLTRTKVAARPAASTYPEGWLPEVKPRTARLVADKRPAVMRG